MPTDKVGDDRSALGIIPHQSKPLQSYRVELPLDLLDEQGSLLDQVIGFAFDTLDVRHLDLRIVAVACSVG